MDIKDFLNFNSTIGISSVIGKNTVNQWVSAADSFSDLMNDTMSRHANNPNSHGFIAEAYHTGSFNLDAALKNSNVQAKLGPANHLTSDVQVTDSAGQVHDYQMKYYNSPNSTMKSVSNPKYDTVGKVVPSDQLNDIKYGAQKASENAKNAGQGNSYSHTGNNASDKISVENVESKSLSYDESKNIQNKGVFTQKDAFQNFNKEVLGKTTVHSFEAAGISMLISMGFDTVGYLIKNVKNIDSFEDACKGIGKEIYKNRKKTITAGATSFISYFTYSVLRTGAFGLTNSIAANPTIVGAISAFGVRTLVSYWDLKKGKITKAQFQQETINNTVVGTGAVLGSICIPIPVIGSIVGTTVASLALAGWRKLKYDLPVLQITYEECFSQAYNTLCKFEQEIIVSHRSEFDGYYNALSENEEELLTVKTSNQIKRQQNLEKMKRMSELLKKSRGR